MAACGRLPSQNACREMLRNNRTQRFGSDGCLARIFAVLARAFAIFHPSYRLDSREPKPAARDRWQMSWHRQFRERDRTAPKPTCVTGSSWPTCVHKAGFGSFGQSADCCYSIQSLVNLCILQTALPSPNMRFQPASRNGYASANRAATNTTTCPVTRNMCCLMPSGVPSLPSSRA